MTETKTDALLTIILGLLVPLLMTGTTDTGLARRAAQQAIDEYCSHTRRELITIAQIVGFALTALDNLRLSVAGDLTMSMKLKLRGNANALSKASHHASETLDKLRQTDPDDWMEAPEPPPAPVETPAPEPVPATLPVEEQHRRHWANAMVTVAGELQAASAQVPPARRKSDRLWANVLTNVATELRQPDPTPRGLSKADLFRTTLMAGNSSFPADLLHPPLPKSKPTAK
jgi:hypothetical protein